MKTNRLEELLISLEEASLTPAETDELKQLLASSSQARRRLVETAVLRSMAVELEPSVTASAPASLKAPRWTSWRPLAAAVAGVIIGCFSTSLVMAFTSGIQRLFLPLPNPGFERQELTPQMHLVPQAGQWCGISTAILEGGIAGRPDARNGRRMMKLGPAPEGLGYFASTTIDLEPTRPRRSDRSLQIEVTARYHASVPGQGEHYLLRAATFSGPAQEVAQHDWTDLWSQNEHLALTTISKALFPTAQQPGWHEITVRIDVPPDARSLVISMGSNTPGPVSGRTDHYMDDVQADWLVLPNSPALP